MDSTPKKRSELSDLKLVTGLPAPDQPVHSSAQTLRSLFALIKRQRAAILREFEPISFCRALITQRVFDPVLDRAANLIDELSNDFRDYAVACTYALLIEEHRRRALSAYFTPPELASAALDTARQFLLKQAPIILDPACGGGAFLVPTARRLLRSRLTSGTLTRHDVRAVMRRLHGLEIDSGLATLSKLLLTRMLKQEFKVGNFPLSSVIRKTNALTTRWKSKVDLVIGNPPYGRVGDRIDVSTLRSAGKAAVGGHTNIYVLFVLKSLEWIKPGGGLVFVLPTSFVAGPYFRGFRDEILSRADVLQIDLHEQRENLFVDVNQDVCVIALRKHDHREAAPPPCSLGFIDATGSRASAGVSVILPRGEPWSLPVVDFARQTRIKPNRLFTLTDYGYRVRVGKVVPTREAKRLKRKKTKRALPLLWASSIRPTGTFKFDGRKEVGPHEWYIPHNPEATCATRVPAVLVQRTSNSEQPRRLNAAPVPRSFLKKYRDGFVGENHVIIIETNRSKPSITPRQLADLLNSTCVNARFSAIAGTFSISATLLKRFALPDPSMIPVSGDPAFDMLVTTAFRSLPNVLTPDYPPSPHTSAVRGTNSGQSKATLGKRKLAA